MEFYNSAIIQDEILLNISLVIERGLPAGPTFLNSLGTLVEAVTLHEKVFFDPAREAQDRRDGNRRADGKETVASMIYDSPLVQQLIRDGVLVQFPESAEVNTYLELKGSDYDYWGFITDLMWQLDSFAFENTENQRRDYLRQAFLMDNYPGMFEAKDIVDIDEPGEEPKFLEQSAKELSQLGMSLDTILWYEGLNHIGCAYVDLSRHLGLNLYLVDVALPHQFGAIQLGNQKAREIYETIKSKLDDLNVENIGEANYRNIQIPPLSQVVLANCKDSVGALADEIFNLRFRHRKFRQYLTEYDISWNAAKTRKDRVLLNTEFDNAWKTLLTAGSRPSTRLIYTLWDILKSPTSILANLGQKLVDKGKEISVIEQVRGLHDFWNELLNSPVPEENSKLLDKLFPNQVEEELWVAARQFSESTKKYLKKS